MKMIPLSRGLSALVDDEDYDRLSKHKWSTQSGRPGYFYAVRRGSDYAGQRIYMHHAISGDVPKGFVVHHTDGDGLNNQKNNLSVLDHSAHLSLGKIAHPIKYPRGKALNHKLLFG